MAFSIAPIFTGNSRESKRDVMLTGNLCLSSKEQQYEDCIVDKLNECKLLNGRRNDSR